MWDELNRILGVNRKSELCSGEPRPDASSVPVTEPVTEPGNESDSPDDTAPAALPGEPEVDLAPPAQGTADNVMPPAVCPDGSPPADEAASGTDSDEPAPGTSPLDDFLPPRGRNHQAGTDAVCIQTQGAQGG